MKKYMMMAAIAASFAAGAFAEGPKARMTDITVTVAAGSTNGVKEAALNIGDATSVITPTGKMMVGVGVVRAIIFKPSSGATNWSFTVYANDAGVKSTLYSASATTNAPTSARYNLAATNLIYSGQMRVEVFQNAYTNAASTWTCAAIVE